MDYKTIDLTTSLVFDVVECVKKGDPLGYLSLVKNGIQAASNVRNALFYNKLEKFVNGMMSDEALIKLADKLGTMDYDEKVNFNKRLIVSIEKIDEEEKIDYIVNASRAFTWDLITKDDFFRICLTIERCYFGDLKWTEKNYNKSFKSEGNTTIFELLNNGIMTIQTNSIYSGTLDLTTYYMFSSFAKILYENSLAYEECHIGEHNQ